MKNRLLLFFLLVFSLKGYGHCVLDVALTQPSVTICAGNVATLTANGGDSYTWYDAPSGGNVVDTGKTFVTPVLFNSTTYYVVVAANGCTSIRIPVTVTVSKPPLPPTASNASVCSGSVATLHADGAAGEVFNWFTTPTGGIAIISSPDYTTPPLTASTSYYVEASLNGCESARTQVNVTVNPIPPTPSAPTDTVCYGTSATLTAVGNPTGSYLWYDALSGGNLLSTNSSYTTPSLNNSTTYYLQSTNGECTSPRVPVNVIVKPQFPPPTAPGSVICSGSATTLTATSAGGTYQWFDAASGGTLISSVPTFTTPLLTVTTIYYVQNTILGCTSPRTAVTVTVITPTTAPIASSTAVCSGSSATLTANAANNSYAWYDNATGGNLLSSAQVFVTPALTATTTYYVETTANGCTSARTAVTVTIDPIPAAPTASGATTCPGTSASLTATTSSSGTIQWYNAATGGTLLKTGDTYDTPVLNASTTYYAQSTNGSCNSPRTAVTVTITPVANPQFQYSSGTFCTSSPNPTPQINNPPGGTFSASSAGLVIDKATGQINISASTPGNYTISFSGNGACPVTGTASLSIVTTPNAQFSYNGPYCQDSPDPLPTYAPNASGGTFTAIPIGLAFLNTSTGEIDLANSKPGTYTVTNTIAAISGCPSTIFISPVTINQRVTVSAGPAQTVKAGTPVQLAGSITGGITTGKWSGGTGSFSDPTLPNAVYTPAAGETEVTLTLTSDDPPAPCGPASDHVTITIKSSVPAPTAAGASVCTGGSITLSATAPGGAYQWYDAPTAGNLEATGPTITTPALVTSTTYYVQTTIGGITSDRTAVLVTVNAAPAAPIAPDMQVCSGSAATLTASGSTGTYQWYDAAVGGNLLADSNTYITPVLTGNSSWYVQTTVNGCVSSRTQVNVTVTPVPAITSPATNNICSGNALNYTITADMPSATFTWSRAQVAGISNPAVSNQTTATIGETLVNTGNVAVNVTYVITGYNGSCPGPAFNYVVTVYPTPVVTGNTRDTICNINTVEYAITFNTASTYFTWSRAAVPGITNAAISGQTSNVIREVLFNSTLAPIDVTYLINYATSTCQGAQFTLVITVNPTSTLNSAASGMACSGIPFTYNMTANIPATVFSWFRDTTKNISNPAVFTQNASSINETLVNTGTAPVTVIYTITPFTNGCPGYTTEYEVTVNPIPAMPVVSPVSPVCVGTAINLNTSTVANASYLWSGPNGFSSTVQNPVIALATPANAGTYTLTETIGSCTSPAATVNVVVDEPPVATAGPDQTVCVATIAVPLAGNIAGGTTTGVWSTAGSGTFTPSASALNAQYIPSNADKAAGSVILTLSSINTDNCAIAISSLTITFGQLPAANAGPDQSVCSQETSIKLDGKILIAGGGTWSTSGSGTFSPSASQTDAGYIPSADDAKNGSVTLTLLANEADSCYIKSDALIINFIPPPTVNAGGTRYILPEKTITLNPVVSDNNVQYLWSPNININDVTAKNPVITGDVDRIYTLTVTDSRGCIAIDSVTVKVAPEINVVNTFTPNADGVNDVWNITGLAIYQSATVDIFNRYGQKVYHSLGYAKPWNGTYNGKQLPTGTYYYIINNNNSVYPQILSGYVVIIR